jgi:hypothetical protein
MRGRVGCWSLVAVTGLAGLFPNLCYVAHQPGKPIRRRAPPPAPVCLEAWVRLRSYRGCPVLAAGGGYRLGIYCFPGGCSGPAGSSNGALVLAGPFPGRAYISERPVPLGRWVHVAGLEGNSSPPHSPSLPAISAAVAIDGADVTAGRFSSWTDPIALGYDPWEARLLAARAATAAMAAMHAKKAAAATRTMDARAARPASASALSRHSRAADCAGTPLPLDGDRGMWRWSRSWRSLSQVAAAQGTPGHLAPLVPLTLALPEGLRIARTPGTGSITPRGWNILGSGALLALAMVGIGMGLRRPDPAEARQAGPLMRTEE